MNSPGKRKLLESLDSMLDGAISGSLNTEVYDESMLSKIESKMLRFLEQSRLKREQIETERKRVRSLIGDISHQVKTPLSNIALYSQLLSERALTEEQSALAEQISAGADKLKFLIEALVKMSRLESGAVKIVPKPGNVLELINEAVNEARGPAEEKGTELRISFNEKQYTTDGGVQAVFDTRWCAEALFNILDNAIKYTPQGGRVSVNISVYEMFVRIDVTDNGRGIRESEITNVFIRFWRSADSANKPGAGIGLYLSREIISACGGYIKVSSKEGRGSTFSVFLSKP